MSELVLLPPLGHDGRLYAPLAGALEATLPVRVLDYPGFGRSASSFDFTAPGLLERLAQHFAEDVARLPEPPLALGGVSLGGTLALRVARLLAPPPRALFLMGSGGLPVARVRREALRAAVAELGPEGFARRHLGLDATDLEASSLRSHLGLVSEQVRRYFRLYFDDIWCAATFRPRAEACVLMLDAAVDVDYRSEMGEGCAAAHVIWGDADRVFGHKFATRLADTLVGSTLHVLPGVGHYAPLEVPEAVADIVRAALFTQEKP
jgi:pimeloyl-ACP methyl ester carboxylesterase